MTDSQNLQSRINTLARTGGGARTLLGRQLMALLILRHLRLFAVAFVEVLRGKDRT